MNRIDPGWRAIASRTERAIVAATALHRGQTRKFPPGLPYIVHPLAVLARLVGWNVHDEDVWAAAALHDVLEDCDLSADERTALRELIGEPAFAIVEELTFTGASRQKYDYLAGFAGKSVSALVVKIADRVCNTRDFLDSGDAAYAAKYWQKAKRLREATLARLPEIESRFRSARPDRIARELERTTAELRV